MHRHAAYYAPSHDRLLADLGARWLGRCALRRLALEAPSLQKISSLQLGQYTAAATRYGWHATMKAPFTLKTGLPEDAIPETFAAFARSHAPITLPPLVLRNMGDYLALVPNEASASLQALAFDCVRALHPLVQPLTTQQLAQRRQTPLSPAQDAMLLQWAYPFVGAEFQWHMTLTGSLQALPPGAVQHLRDAAMQWFEPVLNQPLALDAISWFVEPHAGGDFYEMQRFPLGAS